jgi:adenine-specific DNA-methyltransferase
LQFAGISLNSTPDLSKLEKTIGDPFVFLNEINPLKYNFDTTPFIATEYSPYQNGERLYFQEKTALHIDAIRQTLDKWLADSMIDESGFKYLLASLIEKVPSVSNIAGTYGAYLKHWDTRTFKPLVLEPVLLIDNKKKNYSFNKDGNELIKEIEGEILYVDPPYNGRQYLGNYHLLETIANITKFSDYCKKGKVTQAFNDLLSNSKFDYVFVSYSTEGLLTEEELVSIVEQNSKPTKLRVFKFPYRRYSRIKDDNKPQVYEIVVSAVR